MTRAEGLQYPVLKLHLEPSEPLEVVELTRALGALASRFGAFVDGNPALGQGANAKLLVSNVSPGSIDLSLVPDFVSLFGVLAPAYEPLKFMLEFGKELSELIELFKGDVKGAITHNATITKCQDVANFAGPIANHGGTQNIIIINGGVHTPVLSMDAKEAAHILTTSNQARLLLQGPDRHPERRQAVALEWTQLNKKEGTVEGRTSPDRATIADIDPSPHPVFFTDDTLYLKEQMIGDDENPYQKVYFVDVDVSFSSAGKVVAYRVTAFHGKEGLD